MYFSYYLYHYVLFRCMEIVLIWYAIPYLRKKIFGRSFTYVSGSGIVVDNESQQKQQHHVSATDNLQNMGTEFQDQEHVNSDNNDSEADSTQDTVYQSQGTTDQQQMQTSEEPSTATTTTTAIPIRKNKLTSNQRAKMNRNLHTFANNNASNLQQQQYTTNNNNDPNRALITVSSSAPIVLPPDFHNWDPMDKARLVALYGVDAMFTAISPVLRLIMNDRVGGNQKNRSIRKR